MTPAWMQPPDDVDRWLRHGDRSGYWPREPVQQMANQPENQPDTGENDMPTHSQKVEQVVENFYRAADESAADRALHTRIATLEARIATLERQVARLLEAVPQAGLAGDCSVDGKWVRP